MLNVQDNGGALEVSHSGSLAASAEEPATSADVVCPGQAAALRREWQAWTGSFPEFMADLDRRHVPYLSHSKVVTVERCSRCYYKQYVLGEQPSSVALTTGLLFHRAAATFYDRRREARQNVPLADGDPPLPKHPSPDEQPYLDNAVATMAQNAREGHGVVGVEELFFMDLAPDLAPVIGVIDLILRAGQSYVVVDHKTAKRFGEPDGDQLVLYAEYVRRVHDGADCTGAFDEYRLVPNLQRVRKPAFRRTPVPVTASCVPAMALRYRQAWQAITLIRDEDDAVPGDECWFCRPRYYGGWG